ncbi:MAG TPA: chorismate lyase [Thiobacillaceae bacterium]|nr:chorismate lyase [Thiobacillaceae bacterium]
MYPWQAQLTQASPYAGWLQVPGSLTHALMRRCPKFNVLRLCQDLDLPHADEVEALALVPGQQAMVREVLLRCADIPLVFAHSVIPSGGLRGPWKQLTDLGSRPLGAALFADPRIHRHPLEFKRVDREHPLHAKAGVHLGQPPANLWARRSLFTLEDQPILVTEVFLPEVLNLP